MPTRPATPAEARTDLSINGNAWNILVTRAEPTRTAGVARYLSEKRQRLPPLALTELARSRYLGRRRVELRRNSPAHFRFLLARASPQETRGLSVICGPRLRMGNWYFAFHPSAVLDLGMTVAYLEGKGDVCMRAQRWHHDYASANAAGRWQAWRRS